MRRGILLALLLVACGARGPTEPDHDHPNEILVLAFTKCSADFYAKTRPGFTVTAEITEKKRLVACLPPHEDQKCSAKGWAMLPGNHVVYWGPWVRGEIEPLHPSSLEMLSHHEVSHVYYLTMNELQAEYAAQIAYRKAGCRE